MRSFSHPDIVEIALAISPVLDDLNEELKINLCTDQFFDVRPRFRTDLFEFRSAFPDDDPFLRVALNVDRAVDARLYRIAFVPSFSYDGGYVRNFLARRC